MVREGVCEEKADLTWIGDGECTGWFDPLVLVLVAGMFSFARRLCIRRRLSAMRAADMGVEVVVVVVVAVVVVVERRLDRALWS